MWVRWPWQHGETGSISRGRDRRMCGWRYLLVKAFKTKSANGNMSHSAAAASAAAVVKAWVDLWHLQKWKRGLTLHSLWCKACSVKKKEKYNNNDFPWDYSDVTSCFVPTQCIFQFGLIDNDGFKTKYVNFNSVEMGKTTRRFSTVELGINWRRVVGGLGGCHGPSWGVVILTSFVQTCELQEDTPAPRHKFTF